MTSRERFPTLNINTLINYKIRTSMDLIITELGCTNLELTVCAVFVCESKNKIRMYQRKF